MTHREIGFSGNLEREEKESLPVNLEGIEQELFNLMDILRGSDRSEEREVKKMKEKITDTQLTQIAELLEKLYSDIQEERERRLQEKTREVLENFLSLVYSWNDSNKIDQAINMMGAERLLNLLSRITLITNKLSRKIEGRMRERKENPQTEEENQNKESD
ncbi:MAG: hypothetical protein KatS3mg098_472 [Candidatus Parcubacteria bacterium]|nr:MAG: hypothetical protein KatS3mg098_472 [Candidatus Parcubacteria bacterium]